MKHRVAVPSILLVASFAVLDLVEGQGTLAPSGPPTPSMKTLDQVEARTLLPGGSSPIVIDQPGSYYLTGNLTVSGGDAITITSGRVSLDLNGFTVSSTAKSAEGTGVLLASPTGNQDIVIRNGIISGTVTYDGNKFSGGGFANGIRTALAIPKNVRVTGVSVTGCLTAGIFLQTVNTNLVESCTVQDVGGAGIFASGVIRCQAYQIGGAAITANQVNDSTGFSISGTGINAYIVANSWGAGRDFGGVLAYLATNCIGTDQGGGNGIDAHTATGCEGQSSSGIGINAYSATSCYGFGLHQTGISTYLANSCYAYGINGATGLYVVFAAHNCSGDSDNGTGLLAEGIAVGCHGGSASGTGLRAKIVNSCTGATNSGTAIVADFKYNMP